VKDVPAAVEPAPEAPPAVLVGGGGRKVLGVAGRHADIVGINPAIPEGRVLPTTIHDLAPERAREGCSCGGGRGGRPGICGPQLSR
jgi:alkanesulfonate monooxygenase SsuD/methylene tetrahydromethanopterin reductase-like flavin-dependent oxidoreductase (luciferase family)